MVEAEKLTVSAGGRQILHEVDARFEDGKLNLIIGRNGSGKSTLLKAMLNDDSLQISGTLNLDGLSVTEMNPLKRADKISAVLQNPGVPEMSVFQMVLHGRFHRLPWPRRYRSTDRQAALDAMKEMGIEALSGRMMNEISGGERQKANLAQALCQDTPTLILDEPGTWLDLSSQFEMMERARKLSAQGRCVIMVSHDLAQALEYADHLLVLDRGRKVFEGTAEEFLKTDLIESVFHLSYRKAKTDQGDRILLMPLCAETGNT